MQRLAADGTDNDHLCEKCSTIRVELSIEATTGTMGSPAFYSADHPTLPAVVMEHVEEIMPGRHAARMKLLDKGLLQPTDSGAVPRLDAKNVRSRSPLERFLAPGRLFLRKTAQL